MSVYFNVHDIWPRSLPDPKSESSCHMMTCNLNWALIPFFIDDCGFSRLIRLGLHDDKLPELQTKRRTFYRLLIRGLNYDWEPFLDPMLLAITIPQLWRPTQIAVMDVMGGDLDRVVEGIPRGWRLRLQIQRYVPDSLSRWILTAFLDLQTSISSTRSMIEISRWKSTWLPRKEIWWTKRLLLSEGYANPPVLWRIFCS